MKKKKNVDGLVPALITNVYHSVKDLQAEMKLPYIADRSDVGTVFFKDFLSENNKEYDYFAVFFWKDNHSHLGVKFDLMTYSTVQDALNKMSEAANYAVLFFNKEGKKLNVKKTVRYSLE